MIFMKNKNSALRFILRSSLPQLHNIIFMALIYGFNAFIAVYNTGFAKNLVDSAVGGDKNGLIYYAILFFSVIVLQIVTVVLSKKLVFVVQTKLEMSIRATLFKEMLNKNFSDITAYHSGELMNRLSGDVGVIASAITSIIPSVVFFLVKIVGIFYILFSIDVMFSLVFIAAGIVVFFGAWLFKPMTKRMHKDVQESQGKVRSFMQEALSSLLVIKTFNAQDKINATSDSLQDDLYHKMRRRNNFSIVTSSGMSALFSLGYVWGMIWGAFNILSGNITYGTLTQIITLVGQISTPIVGLTGIFPTYFNALASAERIMEIESISDEEERNEDVDTDELYRSMTSIEFDRISFSFDRDIVLDTTSLSIPKYSFIAIEGISGIGKSTLMKLLLSVYQPQQGEIYLQTNDGKTYVDKNIRPMFSYVPQGNFLLSGTLRENIAFVRPDATDEEIMRAADVACAAEFIRELPKGLNTLLTERGGGLSEGQVQRVAIARAILSKAPVILLDEATSALDEDTELRLLQNLRNLRDKTCIIISHKKAAEDFCDRVITIDNKKIVS